MFGRRAIQLNFVKKPKDPGAHQATADTYDPERLAEIAKDFVLHTTLVVGGAFAAYKVLSTACNITVIAAKAIAK